MIRWRSLFPTANAVNASLCERPKIYASVANRSHPSADQGGGKRRNAMSHQTGNIRFAPTGRPPSCRYAQSDTKSISPFGRNKSNQAQQSRRRLSPTALPSSPNTRAVFLDGAHRVVEPAEQLGSCTQISQIVTILLTCDVRTPPAFSGQTPHKR
jgi:hypothetical protein